MGGKNARIDPFCISLDLSLNNVCVAFLLSRMQAMKMLFSADIDSSCLLLLLRILFLRTGNNFEKHKLYSFELPVELPILYI